MDCDWSLLLLFGAFTFSSSDARIDHNQELDLIPHMRTQMIVKPPSIDSFSKTLLHTIPRSFQVQGPNRGAKAHFKHYINDIEALAVEQNVTVTYVVHIKTSAPVKQTPSLPMAKKVLQKISKYNIPIKRSRHLGKSLGIKKMSAEKVERQIVRTTPKVIETVTPKFKTNGKFKPDIHQKKMPKVKKYLKAVKSRTLTF